MWALPVAAGWRSATEFILNDLRISDLVFGFVMSALGLLVIGVPTVSMVRRQRLSPGLMTTALAVIGTVGGGLIAILYFVLLGALGGSIEGSLSDWLTAATFGLLPGLIVAVVWLLIKLDPLRYQTAR
jgi:hypothetical protein